MLLEKTRGLNFWQILRTTVIGPAHLTIFLVFRNSNMYIENTRPIKQSNHFLFIRAVDCLLPLSGGGYNPRASFLSRCIVIPEADLYTRSDRWFLKYKIAKILEHFLRDIPYASQCLFDDQ